MKNETVVLKADVSADDAGTVSGIAWAFGAPDTEGDVISKGAFSFAPEVPMVVNHDGRQVVGVWKSYKETDTGLEVTGRLFLEASAQARQYHRLLRKGVVTGLSISGTMTAGERLPTGGRDVRGAKIHEISLCKRPVNPGARVTLVKSLQEGTDMEKELENTPEQKAEPAISVDEFAALKEEMKIVKAKLNRPFHANNNQPSASNDDAEEIGAFGQYLRKGTEYAPDTLRKALTVGSAENGGYLAPEEFGNELIKLLREKSPIRNYARVVNVTASEIKYPRRVSGTAATWVSEVGDRTESGMTFEQVSLTPHELATFTDISNQLLVDNAYGLEGELMSDFAESFGITEGKAFVNGTGTGQPKGIMKATGLKEIKTGVEAAFPAENPADVLIAMYHKLATSHAANGVWLMNRDTLGTVRQWKDATGRYLVLDPITENGELRLLGRPIVEIPDMDDIAAGKYPILFGDLSGYRIVDRAGLETLRDPYTIKIKGQTRFHAWKRVGADVTHPDRFIKLKVAA